ncbi:MAG TPA: TIGR03032 family protein [Polyangiaceae bacterium]
MKVDLTMDAGFGAWVEGCGGTVVISTYQAGKLVLVGHDGRQPSVNMRDLHAPMGVAIDGGKMAVALRESVVVFGDDPAIAPVLEGVPPGSFDHAYLPRVTHWTGDIRAHEVAFGAGGLWVVDTRHSCLCTSDHGGALEPRWRPRFVSAIAPEDRCHLSGLAMRDGAPAYVTAHAATDTKDGWREHKAGGGVVVDVASGEPFARGFTMPHSPRVAGGALWVCDSGEGALVRIDPATGARAVVTRLPGFTRGLCITGSHALVGLSRIREAKVFGGLSIAAHLPELVCGVAVVSLETGKVEGKLRFTSGCEEIFDVGVLPGRRRVQVVQPTERSSTSKTSVASGGMTGGKPRAP